MSEWETFCDLCYYYDLWRVRRKNDIAGWETKWKCAVEMAAKAENERDELKEQLDFERELNKHKAVADAIGIGEAVGASVKDQIEALQEQLDAAIMLGKMQERRHERELAEARGESFQVQAWKQLTEQHRNEMRGL